MDKVIQAIEPNFWQRVRLFFRPTVLIHCKGLRVIEKYKRMDGILYVIRKAQR